jgi:AcrR family transcriptional regulator
VPERTRETIPTRADLTRERILEAAEAAFARRGLNGTRVREIAAAAQVTAATLYTYFPNKSGLYKAVLERGLQPLLAIMTEFSAGPGGPEAVELLLQAAMRHLSRQPQVSRLIYLEIISEGSYLPDLADRWFRPLLEAVLSQLEAEGDSIPWEESLLPHVATAFLNLGFGHFVLAPLFQQLFDRDPLSEETVARQTQFLTQLVRQMFPLPADPSEGAAES